MELIIHIKIISVERLIIAGAIILSTLNGWNIEAGKTSYADIHSTFFTEKQNLLSTKLVSLQNEA